MSSFWHLRAKVDYEKGFYISDDSALIFYILYQALHADFFQNMRLFYHPFVEVNVITAGHYQKHSLAVALDASFAMSDYFQSPRVTIYNGIDMIDAN